MTPGWLSLLLLVAQVQPLVIPGERLSYDVSSARFGSMGRAEFSVTADETGVIRLAFDFHARVLLFTVSDHTYSELDPATFHTRRYVKHERSPVGRRDEDVVIDHATSTWTDAGTIRPLGSEAPLDELSFIYLLRNIDLAAGEERVLERHFDVARNPVVVRRIDGAADSVTIVEMIVRDGRQKNGTSVVRFHLSRDERHIPLRIESSMPIAGRVTMTYRPGP